MLLKDIRISKLVIACLMIMTYQLAAGQSSNYFGEKQITPQIPPKNERMRVLIVSDAKAEVDDLWAIALAILSPERFDIEGFVGVNFDFGLYGELGPKSIEMSVKEIHTLLDKAGMKGKYPVYAGSQPMQYHKTPSSSEGVDFIIERALAGTPNNPLWIIGLGTATDLASAYLQEPAIKDRIVVWWHGRTKWPLKCHNYNVFGDVNAARTLFHAPFPFVLFDAGTNLTAGPMEESEKYVKPYGELGEYLYNYRLKRPIWKIDTKFLSDLGDIAVLIDPEIGKWEETSCPTVTHFMDYNFDKDNGKLLRCYDVDRDKTFQLLYDKLKEKYGKRNASK